jgi:RNase P protein component
VDVVIRARPAAYDAAFRELESNLLHALEAVAPCDASSSR